MDDPTVPISKLPNDVIIEILTWLPVKPLLKFKCVCKSWRALISSQQFVGAHLENLKLHPSFTTQRFIMNYRGNFKQCSVNSVLYEPVTEAFNLSRPFQLEYPEVVGSCNGLICVSVYGTLYSSMDTKLILWNPSTRICKELPEFGVEVNSDAFFSYGLGFDKLSDDYKVVGIFYENEHSFEVIVQVYSLRNDQWKRVKNFIKCDWEMQDHAIFVNGKLYWIAFQDFESGYYWFVVSFDLEEEEHEILQLHSSMKNCYCNSLGDSGGSLMVLCSYETSADVWIMNRCSVGNENWTKVVAIPFIEDFPMQRDFEMVMYLKNGQVLLFSDSTFVIIDVKDCSCSYPEVRNFDGYFKVGGTYLESLVSPLG